MATAILVKQKLQYLSRYTAKLPTFSIFHAQNSPSRVHYCSTNSKRLLAGTETNTVPSQTPMSLIKNTTNLIPRKDSTFIVQSNSELEEKEKDLFVSQEGIQSRNAIAALVLRLLPYETGFALAATGGRMGGRISSSNKSSSSSTSSSEPSSSTSSSESSSSTSSWISSSSHSSSSRSSSSPWSSYSSTYYSRPSSSTNFPYPPSNEIAPSPNRYSSGGGRGWWVYLRYNSGGGPGWWVYVTWFLIIAFFVCLIRESRKREKGSREKTSVIKLQVCLLGMTRSMQKDLDQIAKVADTSTAEGLNCILRETVLALLRHPDCCISCYSSVDVKGNSEDGEKRFDQLSIEERAKLDEETLVNVNNIKRTMKSRKPQNSETPNEYIVITILVSAEGTHKLPGINSRSDLKEALQQLGSISSRKITAVEVLWTPQEKNDTLLEDDLLEKYPLLRQLQDGYYSQSQSLFETEQE